MAEFTLGVFPSLVGSMSLDFSFKLAEAAIAKGHKVNMWLSGNAVMMAKKGQKAFKDYSHNEKKNEGAHCKGHGDHRVRSLCRGPGIPQGRHSRGHEAGQHGLVPCEDRQDRQIASYRR